MVFKIKKMAIKTSAQVVVFVALLLIAAYTGGLFFSKMVEYFDNLPKPLITHEESKWGYYSDYCNQEIVIIGTHNGVKKKFSSYFINCNI